MRRLSFVIAKNAVANVLRGGASAIVALVLPHFLTRSLGHERFAAWALMLQLAAYANYLDFGLQTAVARYLAGALEKRDSRRRDELLSTSFAMLALAGGLTICGITIFAWQLPRVFVTVPTLLLPQLRGGLIILGFSSALMLPFSTFAGALIGMQRNELPAVAIAGSRFAGAIAILIAVRHTQSLVWLAICLAGFNLLGAVAQYLAFVTLSPRAQIRFRLVGRSMVSELVQYCSTLSIWSFSMLLISGLDVSIVGYFKFDAVGYYSIAATLVGFFSGLNFAALGAIMAPVAILQVRKEYERISNLVLRATRLTSYLNISATLFLLLFGEVVIRIWVGRDYIAPVMPILVLLMAAQSTRLIANAYATALVGMGMQRHGLVSILVEGPLNLLLSIIGMIWIGPIGVALATLIAAGIGLMITVGVVMRIAELPISPKQFLIEGALRPLLAFWPIILLAILRELYAGAALISRISNALVILVASFLTVVFILSQSTSKGIESRTNTSKRDQVKPAGGL